MTEDFFQWVYAFDMDNDIQRAITTGSEKEKMNLEFVDTGHMRIWIVASYGRRYCGRTAAFRAMFEGNKVRLIIYEKLTKNPAEESDLLECLKDGVHVLVTHVEVGRPDRFENNNPYLTLLDCKITRSWIPKPVAMNWDNVQNIHYFVELESSTYTWNKELIDDNT